MAVGVQKAWSTTASSNATADSNVNYAEGQTPASLNDSARAQMAAIKAFANQITGAKTTGGSADAYTFTSDAAGAISTAYAAGMALVFKASFSNTGASTLNVDGVGATAIRKGGADTVLAANDIVSGGIYIVAYNGTYWSLLNPETGYSAGFQPLDADLTAIAALGFTSTSILTKTAADTWALTTSPSVSDIATGGGSVSAPAVYINSVGGWFSPSAGNISLSIGGTNYCQWTSAAATWTPVLRLPAGAVGTVSLCIRTADTDTGFYSIGTDNWGFAIAGTKYMDWSASLAQFVMPIQARPATSATTGGTLTSSSSNKAVKLATAPTIDGNVHTTGDVIFLYNNTAAGMTITQGSTGTPTQRLHGTTTTGNLTLAARGAATVYFISATEWVISGDVS